MRSFDFAPYTRSTVGFDSLFNMLERTADAANGYPPYDIERTDIEGTGDTHYRITLAVAGFQEKDLSVETQNGVLTVTGHSEETSPANFLYRGISGRQFERSFQLAEHVEVRSAKLENGLLQIELERVIPEEMKPRRIAINGAGLKSIEGAQAASKAA
jgi:molecular chaperone IbpA